MVGPAGEGDLSDRRLVTKRLGLEQDSRGDALAVCS